MNVSTIAFSHFDKLNLYPSKAKYVARLVHISNEFAKLRAFRAFVA